MQFIQKGPTSLERSTKKSVYTNFLLSIPGITIQKAKAVAKVHRTLSDLITAYEAAEDKPGMLRDLKIGSTKLGRAVSKKLYVALFATEPETEI